MGASSVPPLSRNSSGTFRFRIPRQKSICQRERTTCEYQHGRLVCTPIEATEAVVSKADSLPINRVPRNVRSTRELTCLMRSTVRVP